MSAEISHLMTATLDGVNTYSGEAATLARVAEWFDTPQGQVWGAPAWGHLLNQFKHYPMDDTTATAISNSIFLKLPHDLNDVVLSGVGVEPSEQDLWVITIQLAGISSTLETEVKL